MNRLDIIHKINEMKKQLNESKSTILYNNKNYELVQRNFEAVKQLEKKIAFYVNLVGDVDKYDNENFKRKRDYKYR